MHGSEVADPGLADPVPTQHRPAASPKEDISGTEATRELAGVIKSAKRVLEVFDFFAEWRRPLSVSEIVVGLNYPQSSTSVLLKSLTRLGYLSYDRYTRLYMPTLRVALFGGWVSDRYYNHLSLSGLIDDLHQRCGQKMVVLAMQNDIYAQYFHLAQTPREGIPWYIKTGSLRPLCRSAVGRILLSRKPDTEVQQLLWRINAEEPDASQRLTVSDLLRALDQVRELGYAYTEGLVYAGTGMIAVEMPTPPSQPPMALGIGASIEQLRAEREHLLGLLRETVKPYRDQFTGYRRLPQP